MSFFGGEGGDTMGGRYTFGKSQRLRRRRDFRSVFAMRCACGDSHMVVYVRFNGLGLSRLGLSVGKSVGNAVKRCRIKRLIRESFRLSRAEIPNGLDIVCVVRKVDEPDVEVYRASLLRLVAKAVTKLERRTDRAVFEGPA